MYKQYSAEQLLVSELEHTDTYIDKEKFKQTDRQMFVQTDMQRNDLTDTGTVDIQKGIVTSRQRDVCSSIDRLRDVLTNSQTF
jgi:hypothetical protein